MIDCITSPEFTRIAWIVFGITLIILEFIIPGAIVFFFGFGALITGSLVAFGFLPSLQIQLLFWVISSLILVLLLRRQISKWFPALESYNPFIEHEDLKDRELLALKDIFPDSDLGRVRFQGSSWKAVSKAGIISAGQKVKVTGRENLILYVLPVDDNEQRKL